MPASGRCRGLSARGASDIGSGQPPSLGTATGTASSVVPLVDGSSAVMLMFGTEIVGTDLPAAVELDISVTEPGLQGDRVSGATKQATLETGRLR